MSVGSSHRRWGSSYELRDLLEGQPGGIDLAVRDFALVTLAGELAATFPGQLVFKGGFVLRHAHGILRFSKDVDATRHNPPAHKLEADEVAEAIRAASITNVVNFEPDEPATDSARSLDFDRVQVTGEVLPASDVQVEVSYREGVLGTPEVCKIGDPYYEPFEILTMELNEMAAEKLRTLAQRRRETDLADLAVMLSDPNTDDAAIARFARGKFELVKQGTANRIDRINANLDELAYTYDDVVPGLFPAAPTYQEATATVRRRLNALLP